MQKYRILVIDDDKINIRLAQRLLSEEYDVEGIRSGAEAVEWLSENICDLVLLDIHMPGMDGFETFEAIKMLPEREHIPIIFLSADEDEETEIKGFEMGAFDFIKKPFVPAIAMKRVRRCIEDNNAQLLMEEQVREKTSELLKLSEEVIKTLAATIDAKDTYTKGHSWRVALYSSMLAEKLGWSKEDVTALRYMALLHDIGKIGVPDQVLNKPGRLNPEEFDIIKSHTVIGSEILQGITSIDGIQIVARHHHERYDGLGYPDGIFGAAIPLQARIVGIADAFDAMSSNRVYRSALPSEIIRKELIKGRGTQFDPELLDVFVQMYDNGELDEPEEKKKAENNPIIREIDKFAGNIYSAGSNPDRKNRFADICEYMRGLQKKYNNKFTVIVIAFECTNSENFSEDELTNVMKAMEYGIVNNIKPGDVCRRVGPERFMILLFETSSEDAGNLVDKCLSNFYRNSFDSDFKPYYKIADIGEDAQENKRKKIMVVDDNSMNLRIAEFALKNDYDVIKANSGEVALDALPGSGTDLILLDVQMPGMGGFETYDRIKALKEFENTPICFLTASTDEETVQKMRALRATYVNKPFVPADLVDVVEVLLEN